MTGSVLWGQGPGLLFVVPRLAQSLAGRTLGLCGMNEVATQVTPQAPRDTTAACLSCRRQRTKKGGRESLSVAEAKTHNTTRKKMKTGIRLIAVFKARFLTSL